MKTEDIELVGSIINELEGGDLPDLITEEMIKEAKLQLPPKLLSQKIKGMNPVKEEAEESLDFLSDLELSPTNSPSEAIFSKTEDEQQNLQTEELLTGEDEKETPVQKKPSTKVTDEEQELLEGLEYIDEDNEVSEVVSSNKDWVSKSLEAQKEDNNSRTDELDDDISGLENLDIDNVDNEDDIDNVDNDNVDIDDDINDIEELPDIEESPDIDDEVEIEGDIEKQDIITSTASETDELNEKRKELNTHLGSTEEYKKVYESMLSFNEESRYIFYQALTGNIIKENAKVRLFRGLLEGKSEEKLVRLVYNNLIDKVKLKEKIAKKGLWHFPAVISPLVKYLVIGVVLFCALTFFSLKTQKYLTAHNLYREGRKSIDEFNYEKSEDLFLRALNHWPRTIECIKYAQKYVEQGRYYDAEKKYLQALKIDPDNIDVRLNLAKLFILKNDFGEAEKRLNELVEEKYSVLEDLGDLYLKWSEVDKEKFNEANRVYNELIKKHPRQKFYYAKKLEINAKENNYYKAKTFYNFLQKSDSSYFEVKSFTSYLKFLTEVYRRDYSSESRAIVERDEQLFIVQTAQDLSKILYEKAKDFLPAYSEIAHWLNEIEEYEKAGVVADKGLSIWERGNLNVSIRPSDMYVASGFAKYKQGDNLTSMINFQKALEYDENHEYANYYLGLINEVEFNDLDKAMGFFNRAKAHWKRKTDPTYDKLLSHLAYNYYQNVRNNFQNVGPIKPADQLKLSLNYWIEVKERRGDSYLISYAIGNTYLRLREYDLALAEYQIGQAKLRKYLKNYKNNLNGATPDIKNKLGVLSDIYNNIAVAKMGKSYDNLEIMVNKQRALQYLIDSIELKEKLKLIKGAPLANFNRINDANIKSLDSFKIADKYMVEMH